MSAKKVSEANHIFSELLPLNDVIDPSICQCSYPHNQILSAYKMVDIERRAASFVDPIIFALEYHERGSRIFFCCSRIHFPHYFFRVRSLKPEYPTWHEILSNLNKTNLYFDLEYYTAHNPNLNGHKVGEDFKLCLRQYLLKYDSKFLNKPLPFTGDADEIKFSEFDATIPTKFSRHVIVFLKQFAFESAADVGVFVQEMGRSIEFKENFTFFDKEGSKKVSLMDFSVYHEWQNLRMLGSPKFGRSNTLHYLNPLHNHEFRFHEGCSLCSEMLMNTLATCSNSTSEISHYHPTDGDSMLKLDLKIVENYSNLLFPNDNEDQLRYQFLLRSFVCGAIFEVEKLCPDESLRIPLFNDVIAKLKDSNTFWSFDSNYWEPIVVSIGRFFKFKSFNVLPNAEIIRFELGNLLVLLDELQYRSSSASVEVAQTELGQVGVGSAQDQETGQKAALFQETSASKLPKKCRKNMSLLLRFLQNLEAKIEKNETNLEFDVLSKTYQKYVHNLPTSFKEDFPNDLKADNLSEIKILAAFLSDQEDEIRNERSDKVASKTQAALEKLKRRREEEEEFRSLLESRKQKIDDSLLLNLCDLISGHSSSLQFHL